MAFCCIGSLVVPSNVKLLITIRITMPRHSKSEITFSGARSTGVRKPAAGEHPLLVERDSRDDYA